MLCETGAGLCFLPFSRVPSPCRFRMRQVNVVGAGPFSQSSRVIQTLQAPPDVAPTSITVRTASETSLRLRWVVSRGAVLGGARSLVIASSCLCPGQS